MRVALYARVSSKTQEKRGTIASQIEGIRRHAEKQGYTIAEEYVCLDDGISGAILERPGLDRLRDGAEAGQFDAVLVHSPDRLSRKYAYLILVLEEFERLGVRMLFLEQPPTDDPHSALLVQIQGAVAEYERAKLSERHRRGKLHRARQGEVFWNSVPFGYRRIPRRDGVPAHVVINEEQAAIVRQVFRWHADDGLSLRQIAKRMTESGTLPLRGGKWRDSTISRMLHSEAYRGTLYYNRSRWVRGGSAVDGGRACKNRKNLVTIRPKSEWISVSVPAIIDRETFERSAARHGRNRQFSPRRLKEERWLLRRLLRCGKCGRKHACVSRSRPSDLPPYTYYRCATPGYLEDRPRCRPNHVHAKPLDEMVWREIQRNLLDPQLLLRAHKQLNGIQSSEEGVLREQLQGAHRRLRQAESERRRLLDAYQSGFVDKKEFEERAQKLSERITGLEVDANALEEEQRKVESGRDLLGRIESFTQTVSDKLDSMSFHERQDLARTIVEEVILDGDQVHVYFKIPLPKCGEQEGDPAEKKNAVKEI